MDIYIVATQSYGYLYCLQPNRVFIWIFILLAAKQSIYIVENIDNIFFQPLCLADARLIDSHFFRRLNTITVGLLSEKI